MQKWVISMNNETLEYELLALIINYPELLERNILKKEYFFGQDQILFNAILTEYKEHKVLLVENLSKYSGVNLEYYFKLQTDNLSLITFLNLVLFFHNYHYKYLLFL